MRQQYVFLGILQTNKRESVITMKRYNVKALKRTFWVRFTSPTLQHIYHDIKILDNKETSGAKTLKHEKLLSIIKRKGGKNA